MSRTYELVKYSVTPKVCAELASKTRVKSRGMLSLLKKFQTLENPFWETDLMRLRPECDGGGADLGRSRAEQFHRRGRDSEYEVMKKSQDSRESFLFIINIYMWCVV